MLGTLLIFLLTAGFLALVFWVGGLFLQGYLYTQPSEQLYWQAPVGGIVLGGFVALWCLLILRSPTADPNNIPYDTLFRFSAMEDMGKEPVKELKVFPKKGEPIIYTRHSVLPLPGAKRMWQYENEAKKPWERNPQAITLTYNGEELRFTPASSGAEQFVSNKGGWYLDVDGKGTSGRPQAFRLGSLLANLSLNLLFLVLWIGAMLLMRFLPGHALLMGAILWLVTTFTVLPMVLSYTADMSQKSRVPTAGK